MIDEVINKFINNKDVDDTEIKEVFDEITSGLADFVKVSSFLSVLKLKKVNFSTISSAVLSSKESVKPVKISNDTENLIENINFNFSDAFFDIPLACDIVCSCSGLGAVKYSFDSPFEADNSFKTLEAFGIKPCLTTDNIQDKFETANFCYIYLSKNENYYKYTNEISRKLPFNNIFKTIDKLLNPYSAKNQLVGVNSKDDVEKFANICLDLKNSNTIVVSGADSFPYISPNGESYVAEAWKNKIFTYILTPELLGFKQAPFDDIKCENYSHSASIIEDIFQNKITDSKLDIVLLNSALSLYISKKAPSIMDALDLSKKIIKDGLALDKLNQLRRLYS